MRASKCFYYILIGLLAFASIYAETDEEKLHRELQEEDEAYEQYRVYVKEINDSFIKQMERELSLQCTAEGGSLHLKVERLQLRFNAFRRATIEEARALQLYVMNKFLEAINSHEKIQPFLFQNPYTQRGISISLSFKGLNGTYADGNVEYVSYVPESSIPENVNTIFYDAYDPFHDTSHEILSEPYDEAVQKAKTSGLTFPFAHKTTAQEDATDHFLAMFTNQMHKERGLKSWSIGGKMTDGIDEIGARFHAFYRASKEEARELAVFVTEQLLDAINHDEKMKPFLNEYPFPASRVKLRIEFTDRKYAGYTEETMDSVVLEGNELSYYERKVQPQEDVDKEWWLWLSAFMGKEDYQEGLKNASPPSLFKKIRYFVQHWFSG